MLQLRDIKKDYLSGENKVEALKGVSINFRKSEFVSILGQSGCGKTTLLNIIGGLDKATSGDLIINGVSTKDYKSRDWDTYRNHTIGFVFQTYNLIPHQSVLSNVELALSLSGISKKEGRKRAIEALEKVGLKSQIKKKPSELSGGQMQRVAIARALVNNPDIILADEPTGALDSETSIQVMDILKEISKEKLVIMVTHNAELADQYSTRIIRALDGKIISDSKEYTDEEVQRDTPKADNDKKKKKKDKKASMPFSRSFSLSLKNLFTKKGRTVLTAFAGSIGIIGIALIYAASQGMTTYINTVQEDTLSSYPLTLEAQSMDLSTLMETFMGKAKSSQKHKNDAVYQKTMIYDLVNSLSEMEEKKNDLKSFKAFLDKQRNNKESENALRTSVSGVSYTYDYDMLVYTKNKDNDIIQSDTKSLMQDLMIEFMGVDVTNVVDMNKKSSLGGSFMSMNPLMGESSNMWQELLANDNNDISPLLKKQYDVIYGQWPQKWNEIVLVVDENNELNDLTLYALGLKSKDDIDKVMQAAVDGESINYKKEHWSFSDICSRNFRVILNSDCFSYDEDEKVYKDLRDTKAGIKYLYDKGIDLKVSGIIRQNKDAVSGMLNGSIAYTKDLTKYIVEHNKNSEAIKAQLEDKNKDIFTDLPFKDEDNKLGNEKKAKDFKEYIDSLDEEEKAAAYVKIKSVPDDEDVKEFVDEEMDGLSRQDMEDNLFDALSAEMSVNDEQLTDYIESMNDKDVKDSYKELLEAQYKMQYAATVSAQLAMYPEEQLSTMLDEEINDYTDKECASYYDNVLEFSESTYDDNMRKLGYVDLDDPYSINLYSSTFSDKDKIEEAIKDYNNSVEELKQINYTDYVGLIMSSVTTIIQAITYVLIGFVAVSLIVSSIMIGVITLISVQERTKEIGILRALGASKRNVSSMFNAETLIIGFFAGLIGVGVTYLLCIPLNIVLHNLTGIMTLSAYLPIPVAIILVLISMLLTLIAGIIPSRSAAKKDPVVALRTE